MNLRQIVELTGILSAHSPNFIETAGPIPRDALARYEDVSQIRIRNWLAMLDELPKEIMETPAHLRHRVWQRAEMMLVDVLVGGMIARVWGSVLTACDRSRRAFSAEKVARSVLAGQLQAQQGVLRMLVNGPHLTLERVVGLDRLRRKIERWTDLFMGHVVRRYALADFAFDLERALDFGEEQLHESWGPRPQRIWELYFLCLRSAFPDCRLPNGIRGEWRDELFRSMLGCFSPDLFLDDGRMKSVALQRLLHAGTRREGPPAPSAHASARFSTAQKIRWRDERQDLGAIEE